ncbi:MAG TPA: hypothetical protein VGA26_02085 [Candidatus Limnocylindria bacterium]
MPRIGNRETNTEVPEMSQFLRSRSAGALLTAAIVGLALATAYIHLNLGGLLFTLNGLGYVGLAGLIVIGAVAPIALVQLFSWFPRVALIGYTAMTIAAYLVMGPYFSLGFIAKGIEVALVALLVIDVIRVYGSPIGLVRAALESVGPVLPDRFRPTVA